MNIIRSIFYKFGFKSFPIYCAKRLGVKIGSNCRIIGASIATFGSEPYLISMGDHVTITLGVKFITHDGGVWVFRNDNPDIDVFGKIVVGNNVFIGVNSIILPNVTIGDNVVIGAGAVVAKNIPSNCVAVGVPARPTKSIQDYWKSISAKALYVRSLPVQEKQKEIVKSFAGKP